MKTFLCEYIHEEARKELESFSEIISDWDRLSECDAAINRNLQMKREFMESAKNLKVIAMHGTGLDSIDLEAAKELGVDSMFILHEVFGYQRANQVRECVKERLVSCDASN